MAFLEKFPNEVLSYHGKVFKRPITRYYGARDRLKVFHCTHKVLECEPIQVPGTGVMFMRSGTIKMNWDDFEHPKMGDIWIYKFTQAQKVVVRVCPHDDFWIIGQNAKGIWDKYIKDDSLQVEIFNKGNNKGHACNKFKLNGIEKWVCVCGKHKDQH